MLPGQMDPYVPECPNPAADEVEPPAVVCVCGAINCPNAEQHWDEEMKQECFIDANTNVI